MRAKSEQHCQLHLTTLISIMHESPFLWWGTCAGKHKDVFVCVYVCRGRMKGALSIIWLISALMSTCLSACVYVMRSGSSLCHYGAAHRLSGEVRAIYNASLLFLPLSHTHAVPTAFSLILSSNHPSLPLTNLWRWGGRQTFRHYIHWQTANTLTHIHISMQICMLSHAVIILANTFLWNQWGTYFK